MNMKSEHEKELEEAFEFTYQKALSAMGWMIDTCKGMSATRQTIDINWAVTFENTRRIRNELESRYGGKYADICTGKYFDKQSDAKQTDEEGPFSNVMGKPIDKKP